MKHKIYGIIFLVVVAALITQYGRFNKQETGSSNQNRILTDSTVNWPVYHSEKYAEYFDFEFKYPTNWSISSEFLDNDAYYGVVEINNTEFSIGAPLPPNQIKRVSFYFYTEDPGFQNFNSYHSYLKLPDIQLSGTTWQVFSSNNCVYGECNQHKDVDIYTKYRNKYYIINLYPNDSSDIDPIYNQILSTFKFTQ